MAEQDCGSLRIAVLEWVEEEVKKLYAHIPDTIRMKEAELASEERRLANFADFIGEGRGSTSEGFTQA